MCVDHLEYVIAMQMLSVIMATPGVESSNLLVVGSLPMGASLT